MPSHPYKDTRPRLGERVFLAPSAVVTGDVELGDDVSFWFHTVARGDVNWIRIGAGTNVQDGTVLHVSHETHPLSIGAGVVVGHAAVLHGPRRASAHRRRETRHPRHPRPLRRHQGRVPPGAGARVLKIWL